jgi:hypothetical protein
MNKKLDFTVREYLHSRGATKLFGNAFALLTFIVVGQLSSRINHYFSPIAVLSPVIRDPFTVLATAIFLCSRTIFDFMKFRLQSSGEIPLTSDPLVEQVRLPKRYQSSFGDDFFVKAWRWRLTFVVLFGIAAVRWMLTWTTI